MVISLKCLQQDLSESEFLLIFIWIITTVIIIVIAAPRERGKYGYRK